MPKVTDEHMESRKRQILDAAVTCFGRSGLYGATMDDICREAALSKGAVYGYFKSKDDIVSALKVESVQRDASIVRNATQNNDPDSALGIMLAEVFGALAEGIPEQRADIMMWAEALLSQRLLDAQLLETQLWTDAIAILVREAQRRGLINHELDAGAISWMLTAMIYGATVMKSWDPSFDPGKAAEIARALVAGRFAPTQSRN